jgi:hypothetical protein
MRLIELPFGVLALRGISCRHLRFGSRASRRVVGVEVPEEQQQVLRLTTPRLKRTPGAPFAQDDSGVLMHESVLLLTAAVLLRGSVQLRTSAVLLRKFVLLQTACFAANFWLVKLIRQVSSQCKSRRERAGGRAATWLL